MPQSDLIALLKFRNTRLTEELIHYKSENIDLNQQIRDLKDKYRRLKQELHNITKIQDIFKIIHELGLEKLEDFPIPEKELLTKISHG